jgi:TPR repeat protein/methionine-rich copper-binding protein CopC
MKKLFAISAFLFCIILSSAVFVTAADTQTDAARLTQANDYLAQAKAAWRGDFDSTGGDLHSEAAQKNAAALKLYYKSAELGQIEAIAFLCGGVYSESNGIVREGVSNKLFLANGRNMGIIDPSDFKSGWHMIQHFGNIAIEKGLLTAPESLVDWGYTDANAQRILSALAESYSCEELVPLYPELLDYELGLKYNIACAEMPNDKKQYRYAAEIYWFGRLEPPAGKTAGEAALELMEKATTDSTANTWLGLWYLNDDGSGPDLPIPAGETKYTMALKYLIQGWQTDPHGTVRKKQNCLERLADLYESGEGAPSVPKDLNKALEVYEAMTSEAFWPNNKDYQDGLARVQAKIKAQSTGEYAVIVDGKALTPEQPPIIVNQRILVPIRAIGEAFGATVTWDQATNTANVLGAGYDIRLTLGDAAATVNNTEVKLDVPVTAENERILLPLRFIAESMNLEVYWDNSAKSAIVNTPAVREVYTNLGSGPKQTVSFGGHAWLVLETKDDRMLVISEDILEDREYAPKFAETTWETSAIRTYLNNEFYNTFNEEDKARIISTRIANPDNAMYAVAGGNDTAERIFLLSMDEYNAYFGGNSAAAGWWWLRSPGVDQRYAAFVNAEGVVGKSGRHVSNPTAGIRPAMWLAVSEPDPGTHPSMTVLATGAKELTVAFDRKMDAQQASFWVEKDGNGVALGITGVKWAENNKSLVIALSDPIDSGEYAVHMKNAENGRSNDGTVTVSAEIDTAGPGGHPAMSAEGILGAKELRVTLDRAMGINEASFRVERDGTAFLNIVSVKWSLNRNSLVITLADKLTAGVYTVHMSNTANGRTLDSEPFTI